MASTSRGPCAGWASDLEAAVTTGDIEAARRHAHTIAGASGNLGADSLREAAKALETAARDGRTDLSDLLREVERRAEIVVRSIESLRPPAGAGTGPAPSTAPPADRSALRAPLTRLRVAVADSDVSNCTDVLEETARLNLPADLRDAFRRVQELVEAYDFDAAGEAIDRLLAELP